MLLLITVQASACSESPSLFLATNVPFWPQVAHVRATGVEKEHYLMSADLPPDIKKRHLPATAEMCLANAPRS